MLGPGRYLLGVVELLWLVGFAWLGAARVRQRWVPLLRGEAAFLSTLVIAVALLIWVAEALGTVSAFKPVPYLAAVAILGIALRFAVSVPPAGGASAGVPRGAQATPSPSTVGEAGATGPAAGTAGPSSGSPETAKGATTHQDLTRLQQVVSRRMSESKATAPHFYLQAEIDMSAAVEARARLKGLTAEGEVVPSFNDMIVKACALALKEFPLANGAYRDGRFELYSRVNVGVAVAAQDALVVPTVFDADKKGLLEIATDARRLAGKVRDGSITPPELSGGTFTVSNLGMYGVSNFSAVINSPQAAILAVGAITEKPVVRDGEITTAHLLGVTLACDHRILYGAPAAEFLARIRSLLEEPLSLAL